MARKTVHLLLAVVAVAMLSSFTVSTAHAVEKCKVDFRLTQWKTLHFHDLQKAEQRYKTLRSLGCEVQKYAHNGHTDLKYRQVKWKSLAFDSHDVAHKWQHWLIQMGFETHHEH